MFEAASSLSKTFGWDDLRFRPWRELSILGLVLMELSWVVPWYRALTPATSAVSTGRAFVVLGTMLVLSMLTFRLLNFLRIKFNLRYGILVLLLVLSIIIGVKTLLYPHERLTFWQLLVRPIKAIVSLNDLVPDEFLVTLIVLLTWWRGITLARLRVGSREVIGKFQLGFLMLLGFIFINTLTTAEGIGNLLYLYLFGGLLAMGAARITVISNLRGGQKNPFDRRWFIGMLSSVIGLVGLAALVVSVATGETGLLNQFALLIWAVFVILVLLLMAPVILGLLWLLEQYLEHAGDQPLQGLEVLANTLNALVNNLSVLAEMLYEWAKSIGLLRLLSWIPNLRPALFVAIIGGVALVVIALIALSMRIAKSRNGFEERNWLVNRKDLLRLIREAMENRLKRFAEGLANIVNLSQGRRLLAAARIRRVYVQMTNMAADLGHPRLEAQTPLEFLDTLGQLFPLAKMEARTITEAYLKVRYGELPETQGEVDQVEEAWQLVQKAGSEYLEK